MHKNSLGFIASVIIMAIVLTLPVVKIYATQNIEWKTFKEKNGLFTMKYPSNWIIGKYQDSSVPIDMYFSYGGYTDTSFADLTVYASESVFTSVRDMISDYSAMVQAEQGYELIQPIECEKYNIGGLAACSTIETYRDSTVSSKPVVKDLVIGTINGDGVEISFNFIATDRFFDHFLPVVEEMIGSFKVTGDIRSAGGESIQRTDRFPTTIDANNSKFPSPNQSLLQDLKNRINNQMPTILSDIGVYQIEQSYANQELGLEIDFPNGWQGTLIQPANSLIVSPPEVNATDYFANIIVKGVISVADSYIAQTGMDPSKDFSLQEILNTAMSSTLNEALVGLEQLDPVISVGVHSKDLVKSFQNLSGISPPTNSLASIVYEYEFSAMSQMTGNLTEGKNSLVDTKIMSINYSEINGFPAEISVSESVLPQAKEPYKTLGYLFLTKDNIIGVDYSAGLENYEKYLPEFENSIKSIKIMNSVPINEENIKRFVN